MKQKEMTQTFLSVLLLMAAFSPVDIVRYALR